ncbi:MAG: hypothetical protein HYW63_03940 [Candidatus Levybacteria bacterium]|nr:hypothetical protein [Candidatus Levybacteria bacterium]
MVKIGKFESSKLVIVLIVLGLVAVSAFFIFGGQEKILQKSNSTKKATEKDFSFIKDAKLQKHLVAQANQTKMRSKSYGTQELAQDPSASNYFEIDMSGSISNSSTWLEKNSQRDFELISHSGVIYIKDYSDNTWWKQAMSQEDIQDFLLQNQTAPPLDLGAIPGAIDSSNFEALGQETCPGTPALTCYKYRQKGLDPDPAFDRIFWFDTNQYLLRHEEGGFGEFRSFIDYSYDNINITAPSKTKNVPEGDSIKFYYVDREGTPISRKELRDAGFSEEQLESVDY